jgi:uncharacterized SAM-binding protein YcdF (DUF218 family)
MAGVELAYWLGALACHKPAPSDSCVVLLLGTPARADGSPHPVQRQHARAAVSAMKHAGCARLIVSGGAVHTPFVEADVLATLAVQAGVPRERVLPERLARTTWENIRYSAPHMSSFKTLYIVSDSLHTHRGRRYLCNQRPDLCARALPVADYRFGELAAYKWRAAFHELLCFLRDVVMLP